MVYIILIAATLMCSGKALVTKIIGNAAKTPHDVLLLNSALFLVGAAAAGITGAGNLEIMTEVSGVSLLLAAVLSFFLLFTIIMQIYAMNNGPVSLGTLIYSLGFLVPIFYSATFLGEDMSVAQCFGVLLIIVSLVMIVPPEKGQKFSFMWITFAFLAMLGSGTSAVVQKIHQNTAFKDELSAFVLYSFLFASALALIASVIAKKAFRGERYALFDRKGVIWLILISGMIVGFMNVANTNLAGKLPAIIQFPVYNIGSMIITAILGKIVFKDNLSKRKLLGFVLGLVAVTIIGLT